MQRVQHREDAGILDGEIQVADPEVTDTEVTDTEVLQHDAGPGPHVPVRREPATTQQAAVPRLLLDQESAYRVFLGNLTDFISRRTPRAIPTTSTPATFWNDVFLPSSVPWRRFAESLLGHVILVTLILILVPRWPAGPVEKRSAFDKSYVSYYTPPKSFPALHSHAAKVQPKVNQTQANQTHVNRQPIPEHRPAIKVAPEHASGQQERNGQGQGITLPADLVSSRSGGLRLSGSHSPVPMMPLAATGGSQRRVPAAETWLVAPPADASLPTARGAGALQASAVAPAPEVAGVSSRRGNATVTAQAAVVAPAPGVSGAMRRLSDINIGESAVVKPAPQLPMSEQGTFSAMARGTLGGVGAAIVPPPPSVQSAGTLPGGRASLLAGSGSQVVPPAPSLRGASDVAGSARGRGLSGSGPQVVGPAPSVQGAGNGAGGGRMGSLSGGVEAVAPAPSIAGNGYGNGNGSGFGNGRGNSLSGAALEGMAPSGKGTGTGAGDFNRLRRLVNRVTFGIGIRIRFVGNRFRSRAGRDWAGRICLRCFFRSRRVPVKGALERVLELVPEVRKWQWNRQRSGARRVVLGGRQASRAGYDRDTVAPHRAGAGVAGVVLLFELRGFHRGTKTFQRRAGAHKAGLRLTCLIKNDWPSTGRITGPCPGFGSRGIRVATKA